MKIASCATLASQDAEQRVRRTREHASDIVEAEAIRRRDNEHSVIVGKGEPKRAGKPAAHTRRPGHSANEGGHTRRESNNRHGRAGRVSALLHRSEHPAAVPSGYRLKRAPRQRHVHHRFGRSEPALFPGHWHRSAWPACFDC
jgi:hypothetical protein